MDDGLNFGATVNEDGESQFKSSAASGVSIRDADTYLDENSQYTQKMDDSFEFSQKHYKPMTEEMLNPDANSMYLGDAKDAGVDYNHGFVHMIYEAEHDARFIAHQVMQTGLLIWALLCFTRTSTLADFVPRRYGPKEKRKRTIIKLGILLFVMVYTNELHFDTTQVIGGFGQVIFFLAIFPGNIRDVTEGFTKKKDGGLKGKGTTDWNMWYQRLRIPVQALLVAWAWYLSPGITGDTVLRNDGTFEKDTFMDCLLMTLNGDLSWASDYYNGFRLMELVPFGRFKSYKYKEYKSKMLVKHELYKINNHSLLAEAGYG